MGADADEVHRVVREMKDDAEIGGNVYAVTIRVITS